MKFTNGYWVLKPEYDIHFATQGVRARMDADALEVLGATRPIRGRGDMLDGPVLTVRFTAPAENVIRVRITHFKGAAQKGPYLETYETPVQPAIEETEDGWRFTSGALCASVKKDGWGVTYTANGKTLTSSAWRDGLREKQADRPALHDRIAQP